MPSRNTSVISWGDLKTLPMAMFAGSSMCNGSSIECFFLWRFGCSVISLDDGNFWVYHLPPILWSSLHDLRNAKGHPMPGVASEISFLSQLMWCDGIARIVAMCYLLIGWMWCASRRDLWFSSDFSFFRAIFLRTLASLLSSLLFLFLLHFFCKLSSFELKSLSFLSQVWFFLFLLKLCSFSCVNGWLLWN